MNLLFAQDRIVISTVLIILLMGHSYGITWIHRVNNHPKNFWEAPLVHRGVNNTMGRTVLASVDLLGKIEGFGQ